MRLPIVLNAYYRYVRRRTDRAQQVPNEVFRLGTDLSVLPPWMIHHSRVVCEDQQSERWYQMVGALLIDYRYVCARTERERMPIRSLTKCSVYA